MPHPDDIQALASGNNNVNDLTPLHQLSPPLFEHFTEYINQEFTAQEGLERSGARRTVKIGLPSVTWIFASLTQDEYQYLRTNFVSATDALVTIRTYDDEADAWKNYSATMLKPQGEFDGIYWNSVSIQFTDLKEIV